MTTAHDAPARNRPIRWFIHFGPPKTGSTSIQLALHMNREVLFARGVHVPKTGWARGAHFDLSAWMRAGDDERVREVREEVLLGGCDTAVISSEDLFPVMYQNPAGFVSSPLFGPGDAVVLVGYTRPLGPWLVSLWAESTKFFEGMWIETGIRRFYEDRWTRLLPLLSGVLDAADAARTDVTWTPLVLATAGNDAHTLLMSLLDVGDVEELIGHVPNVNLADSSWTLLVRCEALREGLASRGVRGSSAVKVPATSQAARLLDGIPALGLLTPDDRDWIEDQVADWVATELEPLVEEGWLDAGSALRVAAASERLKPAPVPWPEVSTALADATEQLRTMLAVPADRTAVAPPASSRPRVKAGPQVAEFSAIAVVPYDPITANGPLRGGPVLPDFGERTFERHNRGGSPADRAPTPPVGTDDFLTGEYLWAGPVVEAFGQQTGEFSHRLLLGLQAAPTARVLMAGEHVPARTLEILEFLGVPSSRVDLVTRPVTVESLVIAEQGQQLDVPTSEAYLAMLNDLVRWPPGFDYPVLYVSRANMPGGGLAGESYLEHVIEQSGGVVMRPEEFPLLDQLKAYAAAESVVFVEGGAIHGAGLLGPVLANTIVLSRRMGTANRWRSVLAPRSRKVTIINAIDSIAPHGGAKPSITVLDPERLMQQLLLQGVDIRGDFAEADFADAVRADVGRIARSSGSS